VNSTQNRLIAIVLGAGILALVLIFWQIVRLTGQPLPPTASIEQALTQIAASTQAASIYVTLAPLAPSLESATAVTQPSATPAATETPVLAIASPTLSLTPTATIQTTYVVQSGDTLFVIALRAGVSVDDIKIANGLTDNTIYPGQVLIIPGTTKVIPTSTPRPTTEPTLLPGVTPTATVAGPPTTKPVATATKSSGGAYGAPPIPGPSPTWSVYAFPTRVPASGPTTVSLAWKAPANGAGAFQHCIQAYDRAGNSSAQSCAKVVVKGGQK